jgi:hypothetical protein
LQGLCLVDGRKRRLEEKAMDHIGGGANHALGPAVLGKGVGAQETQLNATGEKERSRDVVVKLAAIVALEGTDRASVDTQAKKCVRVVNVSDFNRRGKSRENGIQNHQIVFICRKTEYRGGPEITMNQIKSLLSPRRRGSKWETSMSA